MGISTGTPCCGCSNFDPPMCEDPCAFNWNGCQPSASGDLYDLFDYYIPDPTDPLVGGYDWGAWHIDTYENCGWSTDAPATQSYNFTASAITGSDGDFFWPVLKAHRNNLIRNYSFDYRGRPTITIEFDVLFGGWDEFASIGAYSSYDLGFSEYNERTGVNPIVASFRLYRWPSQGNVANLGFLGEYPLPPTDVFNFKITQTLVDFGEPFDSAIFMVLPPSGRRFSVPSCSQIVLCEYQVWIDGDLVTHLGADKKITQRQFWGAKCYDDFRFLQNNPGLPVGGYAPYCPSMTTSNMLFTVS